MSYPNPLFKPGQIVERKQGDKRHYKVPDEAYWRSEFPKWQHIGYYSKISVEEFIEVKMKGATDYCLMCSFGGSEEDVHPEYLLVVLDHLDLQTDEIDTHVCENDLRLAKV